MLAPTLPDLNRLDREALLKLLLAEHDERLAIHQRLLARETEVEHLKLLLAKLRRMQFGRRSEKIARQIEQLELRLEDLESKRAEAAAPAETQPATGAEEPNLLIGAKPARRPLSGPPAPEDQSV
jgi:transposase